MGRPRNDNNIQNIAREAGVSISTVSRVMNNRTEVSEKARRRVRKVLKTNSFVAAPISSRRLNVGVVMPMESDDVSEGLLDVYYDLALGGIAKQLIADGIDTTSIFHHEGKGPTLVEKLRARACQSAILLCSNKLLPIAKELSNSGIPIVLLNGNWHLPMIGSVDCDCFDAGLQLGRHLALLGHRNISLLQNIPLDNHTDRRNGLRHGLKEAFGKNGFKLIEFPIIKAEHVFESGFMQAEMALKENPCGTAIVGINDQVAYGAIRACAKAGLRIPNDISIAGFDDYPLSGSYNPPLTTVRQPIFEMGKLVAQYAVEAIRSPWLSNPPEIKLPVKLVIRESTSIKGD